VVAVAVVAGQFLLCLRRGVTCYRHHRHHRLPGNFSSAPVDNFLKITQLIRKIQN
jgi:hypothetical protein